MLEYLLNCIYKVIFFNEDYSETTHPIYCDSQHRISGFCIELFDRSVLINEIHVRAYSFKRPATHLSRSKIADNQWRDSSGVSDVYGPH